MEKKFVYFFSKEETTGNAKMKNTLGGKGANLSEMTSLKIPVPEGFTISTEICEAFYKENKKLPEFVRPEVLESLKKLERITGKTLGGKTSPLLVSVRSGARTSMPGMMDTILNLGLNDETVLALSEVTKNPRFALDSYRRFIQMFSDVVLSVHTDHFHHLLDNLKKEKNVKTDQELKEEDLKNLIISYKALVKEKTGSDFPQDPYVQLFMAIDAVFLSWMSERAIVYRELNKIPAEWGTAVTVQSMVFGNLNDLSGTGVAFTRNPSTGEKAFFGEFLLNAQGEDVVAGIRTPLPISSLKDTLPEAYQELLNIYQTLETYFRDMQDIEFTIENKKLYMLQTRNGKRTAAAALKIALDMIEEGLITEKEALLRLDPKALDQLLHPYIDRSERLHILTKGLPASPGGVSGKICLSSEEAVIEKEKGEKVILVRTETSPEDILGMVSSEGVLTAFGGMTSHAAVVARGMGKPCVVGCNDLEIDLKNGELRIKGEVLKKGDFISIDGATGEVIKGKVKTKPAQMNDDFKKIMELSDKYRKLKVRTNADTPKDALTAKQFGAEGIGLCRTEHMFFGEDRIDHVREMILAENLEMRENALKKLLPFQKSDFYELFKIMDGYPVTIRLLDPPLHEFLPQTEKEIKELSIRINRSELELKKKLSSLHEFNPMLGHRGCRLAITFPEIYMMQVRAIAEAAIQIKKEKLNLASVEIMIPLVMEEKELSFLREKVKEEIKKAEMAAGIEFSYSIGTMIELPRAALKAKEIAKSADFFSFGTNDLTQTTLGLSRDDSSKFMPSYIEQGLILEDPFQSLDQTGVGELVKIASERGRLEKPSLKLGVCGEHGGDPKSIDFFNSIGLDYVSCSPFRVPIARLSAAIAEIKKG